LKELESWLERGQKVQFLREICSPQKCTPKIGANIGAIIGILLKDENGEIRYEKVFQWCLPQFGEDDDDDDDDDESLFEFQAARMRNYMRK
jgi:hypothetical protein